MAKGDMDVGLVDELKIDKDCFVDKQWIKYYVGLVVLVCKMFGATVLYIKTCNSRRKGVHFYIRIRPQIDARLANLLQWLLGDDSRRVDFNRARIESGLNEWNKLFEVAGRRLRTIYKHTDPLSHIKSMRSSLFGTDFRRFYATQRVSVRSSPSIDVRERTFCNFE